MNTGEVALLYAGLLGQIFAALPWVCILRAL